MRSQGRLTVDAAPDLAQSAGSGDPAIGLRAVAALRKLVERLEDLQVARARDQGWSWTQIGDALGVTKQSAHDKHAHRLLSQEERRAGD